MHAKVQDLETRPKVTTRWYNIVYVERMPHGNLIPTHKGVHMVREVARLVQEEARDMKHLRVLAGLPWRVTAGATMEGAPFRTQVHGVPRLWPGDRGEVPLPMGPL